MDFLEDMLGKGRQYRSLNCYRSALSTVLEPINSKDLQTTEGFHVGKHPLVCRLLKGAFQLRPPLPKYSEFWSVHQVLCHILSWALNNSLTLQKLTWKLAMLLALCSAGRSSDLSRLSINNMRHFQSRSVFLPKGLAKQSRSTHVSQEISFTKFSDQRLCPVACLQPYLLVTSAFRCSSEGNIYMESRPAFFVYIKSSSSSGTIHHCEVAKGCPYLS